MRTITLGSTGITTPQNAFGALPIQRVSDAEAVALLRRAHEGGMTFFDTARAYSDSEHKCGLAFEGMRQDVTIATKTMARTPDDMDAQLAESLANLKCDYVDIYQFHCAEQVYAPGDGTGMYERMLEYKEQGKVRHIGITAHKLGVARDAIASGLYETLQFPLSYLSTPEEIDLVRQCAKANMGFIAMKGLAGGLLNDAEACMAFMAGFDNVVPIWGVQKPEELEEWLAFMETDVAMTPEVAARIASDKAQLVGGFCRGCGYCMPCPKGIIINQCARMSLMLRRAPSEAWLGDYWQEQMAKVDTCIECGACSRRCPYGLDTPKLLKENRADYLDVLAGKVEVR